MGELSRLIRGGLGLLGWLDADEAAVPPLVFKLHDAGDQSEERIVLALSHVDARLMPGAALANENRARVDELPAEALDSQPLTVRIAAVGRGAAAFLMCHDVILFEKTTGLKPSSYRKS